MYVSNDMIQEPNILTNVFQKSPAIPIVPFFYLIDLCFEYYISNNLFVSIKLGPVAIPPIFYYSSVRMCPRGREGFNERIWTEEVG